MKKFLFVISILIIIFIITLNCTYATTISITEDNFKEHLDSITGNTNLTTMDKDNKTITINASNTIINYNFNNNPTFTLNLNFNNQMSESECTTEHEKVYLLLTMLQSIADYFGIEKNSTLSYYFNKTTLQENINNIVNVTNSSANFTNAIDYAKNIFNEEAILQDQLFTLSSKKSSETSDYYNVELVLTVNIDADFSQITQNSQNTPTDTILNSASNSIENYKEAQANEDAALSKLENALSENNITSLPQTGLSLVYAIPLLAAIALLIIFIIKLKKYNNIK